MVAEMTSKETLISKVLILEPETGPTDELKAFCDAHQLVGLKVHKDSLGAVLRTNVDLGGILFSEEYGGSPAENARLALLIHSLRPELPLILRLSTHKALEELPDNLRHLFCAGYDIEHIDRLAEAVDRFIFCLIYPNALLRGIAEITIQVLESQFPRLEILRETPSIVNDRVIVGEVFSLIPLESGWCRGYMMLQTKAGSLLDVSGSLGPPSTSANIRIVNDRMSEITNLIWGAFKNKYVGDTSLPRNFQVQVPLIVNHAQKYISFGTENPQLCFGFRLRDPSAGVSLDIHQRFIFNLNWSPEMFSEISQDVDTMIDSGELELF